MEAVPRGHEQRRDVGLPDPGQGVPALARPDERSTVYALTLPDGPCWRRCNPCRHAVLARVAGAAPVLVSCPMASSELRRGATLVLLAPPESRLTALERGRPARRANAM